MQAWRSSSASQQWHSRGVDKVCWALELSLTPICCTVNTACLNINQRRINPRVTCARAITGLAVSPSSKPSWLYFFTASRCRLYDDNQTEYGKIFYFYIWEVPIFLGMGVIAGLLGAAFNSFHIKCAAWRAQYVPPRLVYRRLGEVS